MLLHFFGRGQERVIGAEISQSPLQRKRIATMLDRGPFTKGTCLAAAPPLAQWLLDNRNVSVNSVPTQGFFFP